MVREIRGRTKYVATFDDYMGYPMETAFKVPREIEIARAREVSKFENNDEHCCPLCQTVYKLSEANGHPVKVCLEHAVVMPIKSTL